MTETQAKVAVIGAGYWGKNLVRNFHALGVLHAACDSDPGIRAAMATHYDGLRLDGDVGEIFQDPSVEAVAIATPAATHGALVKAALEAGKHVFVEKPLCLDPQEAARLESLAAARGRVLMVGHLLLYHPAFIALRAAVAEGRLGTLRYIYSHRLSLGKIRREENALWSFAPHDVSMILQLAGRLPESVTANGGHYLSDGVADTTLSHLTFSGALQAHIFVSWLHPYKDQRLVIVGDAGMAVFNDVAPASDKLLFYPHQAHWREGLPVVSKAEAEAIPFGEAEPLRRECETFLAAIAGDAHPPSDAAEGIRVLRVLDACQRALESGARVTLDGGHG